MRSHHTSSAQSGFTLLELLLVVGVIAIMFLGISQITRSWVNAEAAEGAGQHLARVSQIVEKYIQANWTNLTTSSSADVITAGATPGSPWAELVTTLEREGLVTGGVMRNPLGIPMRITFIVDTSTTPNVYRASIISTENVPNQQALDVARKAGTFGGTVSSFPNINTAVGAFGQWSVPVASLVPGGAAAFPCTRTQTRGCIVATIIYSDETLRGPYLYRTLVDSNPEFNTMRTDLIMNNNNITDAAEMNTVDLNVANDATLGTTTVNGPATLNGAVTVADGMSVGGQATITGNTDVAGNVMMDSGTIQTDSLNTSSIQAPSISTNTITARNLEVEGGVIAIDNDITVNGSVTAPGQIVTDTINAGTVTANNQVMAGSMNVENAMNISGNVTITSGTIAVNRLVTDDCVRINDGSGGYDDYGFCH